MYKKLFIDKESSDLPYVYNIYIRVCTVNYIRSGKINFTYPSGILKPPITK